MYLLSMYVTGHTEKTSKTIEQVRQLLGQVLGVGEDEHDLEIINVLKAPQKATEDKVFVTPTLVKVCPQPSRRIIGDLSDSQKVKDALELLTTESN